MTHQFVNIFTDQIQHFMAIKFTWSDGLHQENRKARILWEHSNDLQARCWSPNLPEMNLMKPLWFENGFAVLHDNFAVCRNSKTSYCKPCTIYSRIPTRTLTNQHMTICSIAILVTKDGPIYIDGHNDYRCSLVLICYLINSLKPTE